MLNFVTWIVAGGLLGFAASRLMAGSAVSDALLNILAGMVGAFLSGLVVQGVHFTLDLPLARFSLSALASALSGAGLLLLLVNLPLRGRAL